MMCAKDHMNEFVYINEEDTNLIDTSKFSPLLLNTPMKLYFVEEQHVLIHILLSTIVTYINPSFERGGGQRNG